MTKKDCLVLTGNIIRTTVIPDGLDRVILFDKKFSGFGVIKYKSGRVSFFVDKVIPSGKKTRRTIYSSDKIWNSEVSVREIRTKAILISDLVDDVSSVVS